MKPFLRPLLLSTLLLALTLSSVTVGICEAAASHRVKWTFQTNGPIRGSASLHGNQLYFGSADGYLYSVNSANGDLIWKFQTDGPVLGAPAVSDSVVVVSGRGRNVFGLDRKTGKRVWSFEVGEDVPAFNAWDYYTASPEIVGDRVLVGSGDGHIYALQLDTGDLLWKFKTADSIRAEPLIESGIVYQPSGDDYVYALSLDDGSLLWKFETEGTHLERGLGFIRSDIFTRPILRDGVLLIGSRDSNVYGIDIETQEAKWTFTYGTTWAMSSAADEQNAYIGWSTNNKVCALNLVSGEKVWEYDMGAHTYTDGLMLEDDVAWGCADGKVYAFDRSTGELNWSYEVGSDIYSSLASDGECLYFGADDGRLYALTEKKADARKAVYFPDDIPVNASGFVLDSQLAPYLVESGYERLESSQALSQFLSERARDETPSVVVFAYAQVPMPALGSDIENGPLRTYLDKGGKVIWLGGTAFLHCFDEDGNFTGRDQTIAESLLSLDFIDLEDNGNYYSIPTQAGRNLGFPTWMKSRFASLDSRQGVTVLAKNEYGNISAWSKRFHPRLGSGWIAFCTSGTGVGMNLGEFELIDRVASHSLE